MGEGILNLQHIGLPTECMDETKNFYEDLGFQVVYSTILENGQHVTFMDGRNMRLEIYEVEQSQKMPGAWEHIALDCSDIEKVYQIMTAKGYPVVSKGIEFLPFWENGCRFFTIEGPNKEKVEFNQIL